MAIVPPEARSATSVCSDPELIALTSAEELSLIPPIVVAPVAAIAAICCACTTVAGPVAVMVCGASLAPKLDAAAAMFAAVSFTS